MTVRLAQFVHATHDVVDEAFLQEFPEIEAVKARNFETLSDALEGAEIFHVYNSAFTPEFARVVRDRGRALKWIQFTTVGIDVALRAGLPNGVWVTNSGDVSQRVLAGHAIALMLGVMRGFRRFEPLRAQRDYARQTLPRYMVAPGWRSHGDPRHGSHRSGHCPEGQGLRHGSNLRDSGVRAGGAGDRSRVSREKVDEVLPTADVVMVAIPLDAETQGFLSAERIALMKETAILVNISRGKVVDEAALGRALTDGRIMGAGLDAFAKEPLPSESPLWDLPNVLMTPHVGGSGGRELWRRMSELVRDNTRRTFRVRRSNT